jgi:hypothetical protein
VKRKLPSGIVVKINYDPMCDDDLVDEIMAMRAAGRLTWQEAGVVLYWLFLARVEHRTEARDGHKQNL